MATVHHPTDYPILHKHHANCLSHYETVAFFQVESVESCDYGLASSSRGLGIMKLLLGI